MAIATLSIDIVAKLATLEQNMKQATDTVASSTKKMEEAFNGVGDSIKHLVEGFISFETVKFGFELIKSSIEAQAHLVALSHALQVSVEDVGALGFAMQQSGGDVTAMEAAIARLNVSIGKALSGDEKAAGPFKAMGIELKTARGEVVSTEDALLQLSEKFSGFRDDAAKTALAQAELGRGYKEMLVFLDQGPVEIQRQIDFFKRWSGVTAESAEHAHELEKAFGELSVMTHGMVNEFVNQLEPTLTSLITSWIESKTQGDNFKSAIQGIGPAFAQMAIDILESVKTATASMSQLFDTGQRIQNFFRIVGDPKNSLLTFTGTASEFKETLSRQFRDANNQLDVETAIAEDRVRKLQGIIDHAQQAVKAASTPASSLTASDFFQTAGASRLNQGTENRPSAPSLPDASKIAAAAHSIDEMNKRLAEMALQVTRQEDPWKTLHRVQAEIANDPKLLAAPKLIRDAWEASAADIDRTIQAHQRLAETEKFTQQQEEELTKTLNEEAAAFQRLKDSSPQREIFLLGLETEKLTAQFEHGTKSAEDLLTQVLQLNRVRLPEDDSNVLVSREVAIRRAFAAVAEAQGDSVELQRKLNAAITQLYGLPATPPPAIDAIHEELLKLSDTVNQTLGDGLTAALEGRFADIGRAFQRMVLQMIVQATQADLMDKLFGQSLGGARQGGGWIDALFGLGNLISGSSGGTSGAIAGGGAGSAGDWFAGPSGAPAVANTFNIASGVSRSELIALVPTMTQQVTASVMQTMRRPGFSGA